MTRIIVKLFGTGIDYVNYIFKTKLYILSINNLNFNNIHLKCS